jgi:hypothetical protein
MLDGYGELLKLGAVPAPLSEADHLVVDVRSVANEPVQYRFCPSCRQTVDDVNYSQKIASRGRLPLEGSVYCIC